MFVQQCFNFCINDSHKRKLNCELSLCYMEVDYEDASMCCIFHLLRLWRIFVTVVNVLFDRASPLNHLWCYASRHWTSEVDMMQVTSASLETMLYLSMLVTWNFLSVDNLLRVSLNCNGFWHLAGKLRLAHSWTVQIPSVSSQMNIVNGFRHKLDCMCKWLGVCTKCSGLCAVKPQ